MGLVFILPPKILKLRAIDFLKFPKVIKNVRTDCFDYCRYLALSYVNLGTEH